MELPAGVLTRRRKSRCRRADSELARRQAGVDQLSDDAVRSAFGDADLIADLPQPDTWVVRDAEQHLPVVAEKVQLGIFARGEH